MKENKVMISVSSDMDAVSRIDSYFNNMRLPWEKKKPTNDKDLMFSVGVCDILSLKSNYLSPNKLSTIRYGKQAITVHCSPTKDLFFVGLDDGSLLGYQLKRANHPFYQEFLNIKVHEKRLMAIQYDTDTGKIYTVGEDGFLKVTDFVKKIGVGSKSLNYIFLFSLRGIYDSLTITS